MISWSDYRRLTAVGTEASDSLIIASVVLLFMHAKVEIQAFYNLFNNQDFIINTLS